MVRFAPLALMAMTPMVHARFNLLQARGSTEECCPCSATGGDGTQTITVTEPAGSPQTTTVYISQGSQIYPAKETITVTEAGHTVYVTKVNEQAHTVTKQVTVEYTAPAKTITITKESPSQTAAGSDPDGGSGDNSNYPRPETYTINDPTGGRETVTVEYSQPTKGASATGSGNSGQSDDTITKTIVEDGQTHTVVVKPEPSTKTVAGTDGMVITTPVDSYVTVTAAPQTETLTQNVDNYQTVTRTLTNAGYGDDNVIVIIKDPNTGVTTCQLKKSGKPCYLHPGQTTESGITVAPTDTVAATQTDCDSVISTSISTFYNTVTFTVNPGQNSTSTLGVAQPTGKKLLARVPRGPFSPKW